MAHERETIRHLRVGRHRFDPGHHGLTHPRPAAARHTHAGELDIGDVEAVARKCAGERLEVVAVVASAPEAAMVALCGPRAGWLARRRGARRSRGSAYLRHPRLGWRA